MVYLTHTYNDDKLMMISNLYIVLLTRYCDLQELHMNMYLDLLVLSFKIKYKF